MIVLIIENIIQLSLMFWERVGVKWQRFIVVYGVH